MLAVPGIVIIRMPVNVWRIAIDEVLRAGLSDGFRKGLAPKNKVFSSYQLANMGHLIGNFGDIRPSKALRLSAKGDVKCSFAIKPDHAIKPGPVQKQKIKRLMLLVKSIAYCIVVRLPLLR